MYPLNLIKLLAACMAVLAGTNNKAVRNIGTQVLHGLGQDKLSSPAAIRATATLVTAGMWLDCSPEALRLCAGKTAFYAANLAAGEAAQADEDRRKPAADAEIAVAVARELVAVAPASPRSHYLLACACQDYDEARQGAALREAIRLAEASNCARRGCLASVLGWGRAHVHVHACMRGCNAGRSALGTQTLTAAHAHPPARPGRPLPSQPGLL